jgi:REP element-mobilizing transposase RayT
MHLSPLGIIAYDEFGKLPQHYTTVALDGFVVMPNHVHVILILQEHSEQQPNLSHIVRNYKAGVTRTTRRELDTVPSVLWQRRFHDHIIRNDAAYSRIREYVQNNPLSWHIDTFYAPRENGQNSF